ncbi:MAG: hypothetical protein Fur0010_08880 [Bdellovibrio sp.]
MRYWILSLLLLVSCASNELADKTPEERKFDLYYAHGTESLLLKDYSQALSSLLKAQELNDKDSKLHNNLGMAYYFKGQFQLAIKHLKKSIEYDEKNSDAKNNLAGVYFKMGELNLAKNIYYDVLNDLVYKYQFRTNYNLGLISLRENNPTVARDFFIKSIKEKEDYCPAHYELGLIYYKTFQYTEALKHFQSASNGTCVSSPAPHYRQAQALLKLERNEEALHKLKMIIEKFPNSSFAVMAQNRLREVNIAEIENKSDKKGKQTNNVKIDDDPNKILEAVQF